jgi:hypothetical protein
VIDGRHPFVKRVHEGSRNRQCGGKCER